MGWGPGIHDGAVKVESQTQTLTSSAPPSKKTLKTLRRYIILTPSSPKPEIPAFRETQRKRLGVCLQHNALYENFTVEAQRAEDDRVFMPEHSLNN